MLKRGWPLLLAWNYIVTSSCNDPLPCSSTSGVCDTCTWSADHKRWPRGAFKAHLCPAVLRVLHTRSFSMEFLVRSRSAEMADSWCFCRQVRSIVAPLVAQREKKWLPPLRSVILVDGRNCVHPDSPDSYQGKGMSECLLYLLGNGNKLDTMFVGVGVGLVVGGMVHVALALCLGLKYTWFMIESDHTTHSNLFVDIAWPYWYNTIIYTCTCAI